VPRQRHLRQDHAHVYVYFESGVRILAIRLNGGNSAGDRGVRRVRAYYGVFVWLAIAMALALAS